MKLRWRLSAITRWASGSNPGRHKRREIARGVTVEDQLLSDQPHRVLGGHAGCGQLPIGDFLADEPVAEPAL